MQEVFEKIIEKLEERKQLHDRMIDYENKNGTVSEEFQQRKAVEVLNYAIEIVKQEAEKFGTDTNVGSNGWIPCSRGVMPRENGWYLVTNHLGVVQEQRWSANHWEKLRDDAVLAWRELPLPYQPKGEQ